MHLTMHALNLSLFRFEGEISNLSMLSLALGESNDPIELEDGGDEASGVFIRLSAFFKMLSISVSSREIRRFLGILIDCSTNSSGKHFFM